MNRLRNYLVGFVILNALAIVGAFYWFGPDLLLLLPILNLLLLVGFYVFEFTCLFGSKSDTIESLKESHHYLHENSQCAGGSSAD